MRPYPVHDLASWGILDLFLVIVMVGLYVYGCHNRVNVDGEVCPADSSEGRPALDAPGHDSSSLLSPAPTEGRLTSTRLDGHDDTMWVYDTVVKPYAGAESSDAGTWPPPPVGSASKANRLPFSTDCGRSTRKLS